MIHLAMLLIALSAPTQAPVEGIAIKASVNPPAMWIADRVTYTIEVACDRGIDIVQEDLDRGKLALTGLEMVSADSRRDTDGNRVTYTFDYVVTTYRVDVAAPSIGPLKVRYFHTRAGQRPQDAAPAGTITIPPAVIAFRSLLPEGESVYEMRDGGQVPSRWLPYRLLGPIGIGLLLVSIVPAAFIVVRVARSARRRRPSPRRSHRRAQHTARAALEEVRTVDTGSPAARRDAFIRLESAVRDYLVDSGGPELAALTPEEMKSAISARCPQLPGELVTSVLEACELARFATPEAYPSEQSWREALDRADVIVGSSSAGR